MINFLVSRRNRYPINRMMSGQKIWPVDMAVHDYQRIFGSLRYPRGTLIFTDFDHLHGYELDILSQIANDAIASSKSAKVLNHPGRVLERYALLSGLYRQGRNSIQVIRLEDDKTPDMYPVFIRLEDGCAGPHTALLHNSKEYRNAVEEMRGAGISLKRKISLTFCAERDKEGFFRKYGAIIVGDKIIPQHILRSEDWNVKSAGRVLDPVFLEEETDFVYSSPHAAQIREIAQYAGIDYGRMDYGFVDGKIVVYEINTNPTLPRFDRRGGPRAKIKECITQNVSEALSLIDTRVARNRMNRFEPLSLDWGQVEKDPWTHFPITALTQGERVRRKFSKIFTGNKMKFEIRSSAPNSSDRDR